MNDYYYKIIQEYIPKHEQTIIHRNNRFIMGDKKKKKWLSNYILIIIHNGFACFRYCICHVADYTDLYNYYLFLTYPHVIE
tara:strand:- start:17 stop:259 length:243 start_codon:yes stop_codon:yes gene_type:complete